MPSPRTSPAMRPTSPFAPSSPHFERLQPQQQRSIHSRTSSGSNQHQQQRRPPNGPLKLPSLPRFHPANFPQANSVHSSTQSTPDGTSHGLTPQPPMSPRARQRIYSEAQKQLYFNQRELLAAVARGGSPSAVAKPVSPRLHPLGSPGPVTPLELEANDGYLVAGARHASDEATASEELVERLIRAERQRNADIAMKQNAR